MDQDRWMGGLHTVTGCMLELLGWCLHSERLRRQGWDERLAGRARWLSADANALLRRCRRARTAQRRLRSQAVGL